MYLVEGAVSPGIAHLSISGPLVVFEDSLVPYNFVCHDNNISNCNVNRFLITFELLSFGRQARPDLTHLTLSRKHVNVKVSHRFFIDTFCSPEIQRGLVTGTPLLREVRLRPPLLSFMVYNI